MKGNFLPKTALGKWSIGGIVGSIIFFLSAILILIWGEKSSADIDTFFSYLPIAIPSVLAGISGISAFFTGIIGIIKSKERAVIVFIATIIGLFILFLLLVEVLVPH